MKLLSALAVVLGVTSTLAIPIGKSDLQRRVDKGKGKEKIVPLSIQGGKSSGKGPTLKGQCKVPC